MGNGVSYTRPNGRSLARHGALGPAGRSSVHTQVLKVALAKDKEPTLGKDINVLRNKPEAFEFVMEGSRFTTRQNTFYL